MEIPLLCWSEPDFAMWLEPSGATKSSGATVPPDRVVDFGGVYLDQLQFRFGMLVRIAVRPPGLAGQRLQTPIPVGPPEVDIEPALVVFLAGLADSVFHQGLPVRHLLCYTLTHEGCDLLSVMLSAATQL